jgi:hypothetical protein
VDEDRRTDEDQRGDALRPRPDAAGGDDESPAVRSDPLPGSVRRRLDSCASDWLREASGLPPRQSLAGWLAAAAFLLLAIAGWWPRITSWSPFDSGSRVAQLSAEFSRQEMIDSGPATVRLWPWSEQAGSTPGLAGDVVWDVARQQGYLKFSGLEPNDPSRHQYQLWIVDAARDQRYPVDGGVFDVPPSHAPVVIPVHAAVPVREPVAFVVTVEKPGGTVVSSHERIVAVARPAGH